MPCNRRCWQRGVTLIELVTTIAVGSVVVAFMAMFIVVPVTAYTAQTRRAQLVDDAESALRFLGRDLRSSLPNSVRITTSGTVTALEFLATIDGARYRDGGPLSNPALDLDRKSTRLNSSHLVISYAVFCLKKKKITNIINDVF